ncbi:NUDIX hydrolase [Streptomyces wedmorensis]|uniref:NUDIX hydrolase n=1 Tax=Streptomyces wedmorensis TaxID=43759 RepID=UPI0037A9C2A4
MDRYEQIRQNRPELFKNCPDGIEILNDADDVASVQAAVRVQGGMTSVGVVYEDSYITVLRDPVRFPDGALGFYVRIVETAGFPGVVVLPFLGDQVVLIDHYRHATRRWHLEAPRGFGEEGSSEQNAVRELTEELGAEVDQLVALGIVHADSGLLAGYVALYAARIVRYGQVETAEGIRRAVPLTFTDAEELVRTGEVTDGLTIAALARARLAGLTEKLW